MVLTGAQLEFLSKEELAEEFLRFLNITNQLQGLTKWFDDFIGKYDILLSRLLVSKNCNFLLVTPIMKLEWNALSNAQYKRRQMVEVKPVPQSISNDEIKKNVCHL